MLNFRVSLIHNSFIVQSGPMMKEKYGYIEPNIKLIKIFKVVKKILM